MGSNYISRRMADKPTSVPCFRQWNNKSYAIFNSLHKCVKIGVLCVTYSMLNIPEQCHAQTDTAAMNPLTVDLDEVEITADRAPDIFSPTGRTINQISRATIEQAPVQSLTDILQYAPSVDLRQRGPNGAQADISIRGSSFDQTIVLLNGINISDPQTGHYTMNIPLDIESVDRIEILEGPASRIFGANALGGAINFITGTKPTNSLNVSLTGGEYGFYKASTSATLVTKYTSHHAAVSKMASDGYIPNTDFDNLNVFSQNKWNNRYFPLDLQLGYTEKALGANGFYGAKYPNQYEELNTFFASLKGESQGRVKISPSLYWRRNDDHYVLIRDNPEIYQNFHRTDVYGAELNASLMSWAGKTTAGVLLRSERIYSSNLGEEMSSPRKVPRQDDAWYTKTDLRNNLSFFVEQNVYFGRWSASAGVLLNYNSYTGNDVGVYPGVDVSYRAGIFKIYASANRAMRLPTFTDLYYQGPMNIGNRDLQPEYCTEYELGVKTSAKGWKAGLSYFYRNTQDAIDWIWLDSAQAWHTQNLTKLHTNGISITNEWNISQSMGANFPLCSAGFSYSFMSIGKHAGEYASYYALDYLKHRLNITLTHRIVEKVCAQWQVRWQDRNGTYLSYDAETGIETEVPYDPFWQIDLRIYRKTKRLNIFAEASNLGNVQHYDIGNIVLPGRWIRCGIALTLTK